jgi:hypothetical protein
MTRLQRIGMVSAMALAFAAPAFACSILPPPPPPPAAPGTPKADVEAAERAWSEAHGRRYAEEQRAWTLKQQARLFDEAKGLVVVRFDRQGKVSGMPKELDHMNGDPLAILKPVRWVKGQGSPNEIVIGSGLAPPCGQIPAHDAFYGKPGEVFLLYIAEDNHVLDGFRIEKIIEPRAIAALTAG